MIDLMGEIMGNCLAPAMVNTEKFWVFMSDGQSGKSTLSGVLQLLVGKQNCCAVPLDRMNTRFGLEPMLHKTLNIAGESKSFGDGTEMLKSLVSGETVNIQRKNKTDVVLSLKIVLIFLSNGLQPTDDRSYGLIRRLGLVPFQRISNEKVNPQMLKILSEEMPGIFNFAVEGLRRLISNNYVFTIPSACKEALQKYELQCNNTLLFLKSKVLFDENYKMKKSELYPAYVNFTAETSTTRSNREKFWESVETLKARGTIKYDIRRIKGYDYLYGLKLR